MAIIDTFYKARPSYDNDIMITLFLQILKS